MRFLIALGLLALPAAAMAQTAYVGADGRTHDAQGVCFVQADKTCAAPSTAGGGSVTQGTSPWVENIAQWGGTATSLGAKTSATSVPVALSTDGVVGAQTDAACATADATACSLVALYKEAIVKYNAILANQTATGANAQTMQGNVADDTVDAGNSVKIGGTYYASGSLTAMTVGNRRGLSIDGYGSVRVRTVGYTLAPGAIAAPSYACYGAYNTNTASAATCYPLASGMMGWTGSAPVPLSADTAGLYSVPTPTASAANALAPLTVYAATSNVLKASPGNAYGISMVNSTVAGFLMLTNLTAAPTSGTAIAAANMLYCMPVAASVGFDKVFMWPVRGSAGLTALFSTSCTTYTPVGTAPVSITGMVQ